MTPTVIFICVAIYSVLLFIITWLTSRNATNDTFYHGNRSSRWYVVAYGMIGASLSGVTFMSVPGLVGATHFAYMQMVMGYLVGYTVIATLLLPLYYRLNLTSIYSYLHQRFGFWSYKTGAFFFILSRTIGSAFRLYIVVNVLQVFVFDAWGIPFYATTATFILLILLYTYQGGVKTIVWTDTLQTTFMLLAVVLSLFAISSALNTSVSALVSTVFSSDSSKLFVWDWHSKFFFPKQFFGGMFIAITMTGLDQEMMQKNISCKNIGEAQKNMFTFSGILLFVNLMFLVLGAILLTYVAAKGIELPKKSDDLFPMIALQFLGPVSGIVFIIGLISAAYPSADGALTALTTSFCIDILGIQENPKLSDAKRKTIRHAVHIGFALLLLLVVVVFRIINNEAVVNMVFKVANYTYGPLLGLFAFGLFNKQALKDKLVPFACLLAPILCYFISENSKTLLGGYEFGNELLILNGFLTFLLLLAVRESKSKVTTPS